jgi:hypothetical protein
MYPPILNTLLLATSAPCQDGALQKLIYSPKSHQISQLATQMGHFLVREKRRNEAVP